ncbi:Myb-like HTH transcriptional regulator family protein [Hibiscus syriacus]|uniref:Myb-like HTH transcriptional regulator family protein n=1 Tax=Hibiscus syriacus TaxID=106335 RepID=A0A6A2WCN3_HIBSY|nr:Myb-like HTH transcriptional regulator family protein [Hibiscus syriacus]
MTKPQENLVDTVSLLTNTWSKRIVHIEHPVLIDGRKAVCNLAFEGLSGLGATPDLAQRKLYIGGLSPDVSGEMLLNYFGRHGEIEEGSVAYEKDTNESRGFGFVTYKDSGGCKESD